MSDISINDFAIKIATPNGTGSSSANSLLVQAIFRMGVPIAGKNIFPSNIQGLPTWYEIRINKSGHLGRKDRFELVVAMNAQTYLQDVRDVRRDGYLLYDTTWPPIQTQVKRAGLNLLGVPFAEISNSHFGQARERTLMKNICYVGVVAALCGIEMDIIKTLLQEKFQKKQKLLASNFKAIELGYDYAQENLSCPLPIQLVRMNATHEHILIDGNSSAALASVYAGATVAAWYPITPSTALLDAFQGFCRKFRQDRETGNNYCILQAEDEMAALGMVLGATWNGARAFTATSGPGISLMAELIGFAYYAELPAVIFNVQRVGPSTGMPTRTQQSDMLACAYASHGDTKHVLVFPADPEESFHLTIAAFDLADMLQTPVFVMMDLDIGMNDWLCPRLTWSDSYQPERGKVLQKFSADEVFFRYHDRDQDGICYRTLPGTDPAGAFFTRGSGHNKFGAYTENGAEYQEVLDRLQRKHETAKEYLPLPLIDYEDDLDTAIVTIGSCHEAVIEAKAMLEGQDIELNYMRIKAFPFHQQAVAFFTKHKLNIIIEQNRDAQLYTLLIAETPLTKDKLTSLCNYDGLPLTAEFVCQEVQVILARKNKGT